MECITSNVTRCIDALSSCSIISPTSVAVTTPTTLSTSTAEFSLGEINLDLFDLPTTTFQVNESVQPSANQPSANQPSTNQPLANQPSTNQLSTSQPSTNQLSTNQPSTNQPSANQPSSNQPSTNKSSTSQPSTNKSSTKRQSISPEAIEQDYLSQFELRKIREMSCSGPTFACNLLEKIFDKDELTHANITGRGKNKGEVKQKLDPKRINFIIKLANHNFNLSHSDNFTHKIKNAITRHVRNCK